MAQNDTYCAVFEKWVGIRLNNSIGQLGTIYYNFNLRFSTAEQDIDLSVG
jgi:hypothetical protein